MEKALLLLLAAEKCKNVSVIAVRFLDTVGYHLSASVKTTSVS